MPRILLVTLLLARGTALFAQARGSGALEAVLLAEDRRAMEKGDEQLLLRSLSSADSLVVRRAARAIGRLERPGLAPHLLPLLAAPLAGVREAAAEAIAQAAQGFRRDSSPETRGAGWAAVVGALRGRMRVETDGGVLEMLSLSLGRLPWIDGEEIAAAREDLLQACEARHHCRGIETLLRATARRAAVSEDIFRRLRGVAQGQGNDSFPRRNALGALLASQGADDSTLMSAVHSPDAELRRLALTGLRRAHPEGAAHPVLSRGLDDPDPAVRLEALRALSRVAGMEGCARLARGARDSSPQVALMGIDLLGACGRDTTAVGMLEDLAGPSGVHSTTVRSHALLSLARASPSRAAPLIPAAAASAGWLARSYTARAALAARDTASLYLLAGDMEPNVREAAITGLHETVGHSADPVYREALGAADYQLVRTAAGALAGTPDRPAAVSALLAALDRITRQRAETSRDPRVEILVRLRELGTPALARRLMPYLTDFDPVVADSAAAILTSWTGQTLRPAPRRLPIVPVSLAEADAFRGVTLRFTMASGGEFEVDLFPEEAPATVVRIARLVRRHYYDGLTFHRLAPNFVIQGGSPGANEYSGYPAFMPDELSALTHARGTLGVSTRGRDTGDAQLFVNLRDNPRLDYDYTVFGRVVSGLQTVENIMEGDVIRRVDIRSR